MDQKTQISFDLQKYVEKYCNGRSESTTKHENTQQNYIVLDLIDFFGDD